MLPSLEQGGHVTGTGAEGVDQEDKGVTDAESPVQKLLRRVADKLAASALEKKGLTPPNGEGVV